MTGRLRQIYFEIFKILLDFTVFYLIINGPFSPWLFYFFSLMVPMFRRKLPLPIQVTEVRQYWKPHLYVVLNSVPCEIYIQIKYSWHRVISSNCFRGGCWFFSIRVTWTRKIHDFNVKLFYDKIFQCVFWSSSVLESPIVMRTGVELLLWTVTLHDFILT